MYVIKSCGKAHNYCKICRPDLAEQTRQRWANPEFKRMSSDRMKGPRVGPQKCAIEDCLKQQVCRGWCGHHNYYWSQYGNPLYERPILSCSVPDCKRDYSAKGYCFLHYERTKKNGNPGPTDLLLEYHTSCSEAECGKKHYSKGLCRNHYKIFLEKPKARAQKRGAPSDLTVKQWRAKLAAYGNHCAYCGVWSKALTQDHIRPLSKGGHHTVSNIVPACRSCNSRKSDSVNKYLPMSPSVISACFSLAP